MNTTRQARITAELARQYRAEYWMGFRWNFIGGFDSLDAATEAAKRNHAAYDRPVRVNNTRGFMDNPFTLGAIDPAERCSV